MCAPFSMCREQFQSELRGGVNYEMQNLKMDIQDQGLSVCVEDTGKVLRFCNPREQLCLNLSAGASAPTT